MEYDKSVNPYKCNYLFRIIIGLQCLGKFDARYPGNPAEKLL